MPATYKGIVEHGTIRIIDDVALPEQTVVDIVILDESHLPVVNLPSPRLKESAQIVDFTLEVGEEEEDDDTPHVSSNDTFTPLLEVGKEEEDDE